MKKFRNITLIAGAIIMGFALLATVIPGITITDYTLGFLTGFSATLLLAGLVLAVVPVFCKKDKGEKPEAKPAQEKK